MANNMSLAEQAYDRIEEWIVTLALPPGHICTESELAEQLEMGRTPVREALQRLASESLISIVPRRGIRISEINIADQLNLLDTRKVLDRLIAERAARRAGPDQREKLIRLSDEIIMAGNHELGEFMRTDHDCDLILWEAARNPYAIRAVAPLHVQCRRFWYYYQIEGDLKETARLHRDLMMAVARGDTDASADASDRIVDYMMAFTRKTIDL